MNTKPLLSLFIFSLLSTPTLSAENQQLTLAVAENVTRGCIDYAVENKLTMAIAVYDIHGNLKSFARMDGATLGSAKVAQWKGLSAAVYHFSTAETKEWNVPNAPDIATVAGGLPIKDKNGNTIGGVGVSGAASSVDVSCAETGLAKAKLLNGSN